jgi:hypothetical protein
MKKTMILGCAVAVLAFTSFNVTASDVKYPAANFQPQVIYLDKSVATEKPAPAPAASEVDPKYPAANFQPTVIYSADSVTSATKAPAAAPVAEEVDPKYPAASFQPKVIYP